MPLLKNNQYRLEPYSGPSSRTTCPNCGTPRTFTRYIDTYTGELLPAEYGRCDREVKCGYARSPYSGATRTGLGYSAPIKSQKSGGRQAHANTSYSASVAGLLTIPPEVYLATVGHYQRNKFARLLQRHFGVGEAQKLCAQFQLGTSSFWDGACIFWLLDEHGRVRGGQVVEYDDDGRTVRCPERRTRPVHMALLRGYRQGGQPVPTWLQTYADHGAKSPCLFGLPQLNHVPADKPVAVVESAKTAILATGYMPDFVWVATMGLSNLTPDRLAPLRGRCITLYPDAGAFEKWNLKAGQLRARGFRIEVSDTLEKCATAEERRMGLDIGDVLLREYEGFPPSWNPKR
jgi:hypothetical protein